MRRFLATLRHGAGLRHVPIAVAGDGTDPVRVELHRPGSAPLDVTRDHAPVSLRPMIIGLRLPSDPEPVTRGFLVLRDVPTKARLGELALEPAGALPLGEGRLSLFAPAGCRNHCAPAPVRWWRYALAGTHARRSVSRGDALRMSAADLRCLDVYSISPRRLFVIGVGSGAEAGLFTATLVSRLASGDVLLSLPASSAEIGPIEAAGTIALSAAPAALHAEVVGLGAYERVANRDADDDTLPVRRIEPHGLPALANESTLVVSVRDAHRVGSHMLLVCGIEEERPGTERQIAYVSAMYAEWLARRGRTVDALA